MKNERPWFDAEVIQTRAQALLSEVDDIPNPVRKVLREIRDLAYGIRHASCVVDAQQKYEVGEKANV